MIQRRQVRLFALPKVIGSIAAALVMVGEDDVPVIRV
jgi:hypothetical protein